MPARGLQILDGLEQRHDVDRAAARGIDEAGLLQEQRDLQHVGHPLAHRDDALGDRVGAEFGVGFGGRMEDREFAQPFPRCISRRSTSAAGRCAIRSRAARSAPPRSAPDRTCRASPHRSVPRPCVRAPPNSAGYRGWPDESRNNPRPGAGGAAARARSRANCSISANDREYRDRP